MTMVVIHARFVRFLTPYASCDTAAHYRPFFTEKTTKNVKFVKNQNNLAWCLELVIQGMKKIGAISSMSGNDVLLDGAISPTRTPPLIMV